MARHCLDLYITIGQTKRSLQQVPNLKLNQNDRRAHTELSILTTNCMSTLKRLERMLGKYKSLATSHPTFLDTVKFALNPSNKEDLADIRSSLNLHLAAIGVFLQNVNHQKMEGKLDAIQQANETSIAQGLQDGRPARETNMHLSGLQDSLPKAIAEKSKKIRDKHSLTEWHGAINFLTAAESCKEPMPEPSIQYSESDERLNLLPEGWQRVHLNDTEYRYCYLFRKNKQISTRLYNKRAPFDLNVDVELDVLPPGWEEVITKTGSTHYFQPSTGCTQLRKPSVQVCDRSEEHIIGHRDEEELDDMILADLHGFQRRHFDNSSTEVAPDQPVHNYQTHSSSVAQQYAAEEEAKDDGLGYYPDGVKRTLTDEQISMFRNSEIYSILRKRQLLRENREAQEGLPVADTQSPVTGAGHPFQKTQDDQPFPFHDDEAPSLDSPVAKRRKQDYGGDVNLCSVTSRRRVRELDDVVADVGVLDYGEEVDAGGNEKHTAVAGESSREQIDKANYEDQKHYVGELDAASSKQGREIWWPTIG
ncbi:MAG: hypothetical protein Q9170_007080 [Blastenia crenularia]